MSLWKKPVEKVVLNVATGLAKSRRSVVPVAGIDESKVEADRFVAAFCGTGTGHFTQTLAVIKILQKAGMTLAAAITVRCAPRPAAVTRGGCSSRKELSQEHTPFRPRRPGHAAMPDNALPTAQDDAASKKMLDETILNLGVEVLILPTVNFVDPVRRTSPQTRTLTLALSLALTRTWSLL